VVVADVRAEDGERLAQTLDADGGTAAFVACDVTDESEVDALMAAAEERFGALDALVNNAAVYMELDGKRPTEEVTVSDWDRVMAVNVRGPWLCARAAAPRMRARGSGSVVNIASTTAIMGTAGFAHYVASKSAVIGLTRALARELGPDGIRVNAIAPGLVANESSRTLNDDTYLADAARGRALARAMAPEDLVGTVLFLASPASEFVTGQTLVVDGGGVMQ
jgi:NAD(P)-dependent dehydrogenase (short-subunit alcohol dehydrogenase family)